MCNELCVVPPCPALEAKIVRSKQLLMAGGGLPDKASADFLDLGTVSRILNRPPKTRAHTLVSPTVQFAPTAGSRKALVLLVDFSDAAAVQTQAHFQEILFSVGTHATGSMRDFYREASYGKLDVIGEVSGTGGVTAGWYRAPKLKSYYTNGDYGFGAHPQNAQKLVEDVVALARPHVNFADYDNDEDGIVDALVVIAAGTGGEVSGNTADLWSHKWTMSPIAADGVSITTYFMAPEDGNVGVMCHELGHLLMKWPDLYDTDYSSKGTGRWDLMAGGSWNDNGNTPAHPTAWCKLKAGWIDPIEILNGTQNVSLRPYANQGDVYKLPIGGGSGKEYFLVSNRHTVGFDSHLPGAGCIIEHVDDSRINNTDETHYLVDIEQADGQSHLNSNANGGDFGDAYPNGAANSFTASTTPASRSYDGSDSKIEVTAITRSGTLITATLSAGGEISQAWQNSKLISRTYTTHDSENAWADIQGLGWRKIETGNADGVTDTLMALAAAQANNRPVNVYVDGEKIYRVTLG
jgi:immune inhibitor A